MTDLHTHILPGIDDGAKDVETSLAMLRMERAQGVDNVVLTPHFYRDLERPREFLLRRAEARETLDRAIAALSEDERRALPRLSMGAEVAWVHGMADWSELCDLCYEGTNYLLLEPPFHPWEDTFFHELYDLMNRGGVVPVIAHLDRYLGTQKSGALKQLFELRLPTQLSAEPFLHFPARLSAFRCILKRRAQLLISDCHDTVRRPPNLGAAMAVIRNRLGKAAEALFDETDELLLPIGWDD